jgi:hypothetical protein
MFKLNQNPASIAPILTADEARVKTQLLARLRWVAEHQQLGHFDVSRGGICIQLSLPQEGHFVAMFPLYPGWSGHPSYPIGPTPKRAQELYHDYDVPDWTGSYGAARRRLLLWAISRLEWELGLAPVHHGKREQPIDVSPRKGTIRAGLAFLVIMSAIIYAMLGA